MTHHGNPEEHEGSGPAEPPAGDDPAENTAPPGNPEPDPERVEEKQEDLDRAGAN
jgi:hypothetical protein